MGVSGVLFGQRMAIFLPILLARENSVNNWKWEYMQHIEHITKGETSRLEEIALLTFHSKQDFRLAMRSYARVNKTASYSGFIVFVVMSYFLHGALLTGHAENSAHLLALIVNIALTLITYKLIREFHPMRMTGAKYWQSCDERKKQIQKLNLETHA